jgi:hypothetical protein
VGVPLRKPELESVSPAGTPGDEKVYGGVPPAAMKFSEYAVDVVPEGSVVDVVIPSTEKVTVVLSLATGVSLSLTLSGNE